MTRRTYAIEMPDEYWRAVDDLAAAIDGVTDTRGLIQVLLDHVQQGVRRPGAWEAEWVRQLAGDEAVDAAGNLLHFHATEE